MEYHHELNHDLKDLKKSLFRQLLDEQTKHFNAIRECETEENDEKYAELVSFADSIKIKLNDVVCQYENVCSQLKKMKKEEREKKRKL